MKTPSQKETRISFFYFSLFRNSISTFRQNHKNEKKIQNDAYELRFVYSLIGYHVREIHKFSPMVLTVGFSNFYNTLQRALYSRRSVISNFYLTQTI